MSQSPIRNYAIVREDSPEACVHTVQDGIANGFQPVGGVAIAREPGTPGTPAKIIYVQAMVRLWQPGERPPAGIVVPNGKVVG